jgi:ABC-2 type transport system ATP-binding protein
MIIQVQQLTKFYGHFVALSGVSFEIPEGQIVALLGPNGAGKTTMMRILTGYLTPSAGTATVAGFDVQRDRLEAAARIGYLPENGPLYPDMTARELLRFFGDARGLSRDRLASRIDVVVRRCDLGPVLDKPVGKLSKGLRQRVGLAQALLHDPPILIMDEPTAGLDPNQIRQFRAEVRALGPAKTLLVSTHILQEVEAIADRVLLIHGGRLVFDGSPAELAENGSLEEPFYRLTRSNDAGDRAGTEPDERAASAPDGLS